MVAREQDLGRWLSTGYGLETVPEGRPKIQVHETKAGMPSGSLPVHDLNTAEKALFTLGKNPTCDVQALHMSVSRRHVAIATLAGGSVVLVDLGSRGGTVLNRKGRETTLEAFKPCPVYGGDSFVLANSSRSYSLQVDLKDVIQYHEQKQQEMERSLRTHAFNSDDPNTIISKGRKIYLGNLSFKTSRADVVDLCSKYGDIEKVVLPRQTAKADDTSELFALAEKGYAFVFFADWQSALKAVNDVDGRSLNGRPLRVDFSAERPDDGDHHREHRHPPRQKSLSPRAAAGGRPADRDRRPTRQGRENNTERQQAPSRGVESTDLLSEPKSREELAAACGGKRRSPDGVRGGEGSRSPPARSDRSARGRSASMDRSPVRSRSGRVTAHTPSRDRNEARGRERARRRSKDWSRGRSSDRDRSRDRSRSRYDSSDDRRSTRRRRRMTRSSTSSSGPRRSRK